MPFGKFLNYESANMLVKLGQPALNSALMPCLQSVTELKTYKHHLG